MVNHITSECSDVDHVPLENGKTYSPLDCGLEHLGFLEFLLVTNLKRFGLQSDADKVSPIDSVSIAKAQLGVSSVLLNPTLSSGPQLDSGLDGLNQETNGSVQPTERMDYDLETGSQIKRERKTISVEKRGKFGNNKARKIVDYRVSFDEGTRYENFSEGVSSAEVTGLLVSLVDRGAIEEDLSVG
ncbi:hypothetical protein QYF36_006457 [Acer negundo]|nr:hypothetical protein QYF36_006457 [Acer negundo]